MISVKAVPVSEPVDKSVEGKILNGNPGRSMIHKVGSAKQYATKSTGRVCNQAKFPTSKNSPSRKQG